MYAVLVGQVLGHQLKTVSASPHQLRVGGHRFGTLLEATQRGVSRGVVDHRSCGDNSALLASAVTLCHGDGIDPFRSEVPQLVAPNLRVYRTVPLQSLPGESCRDHPAAQTPQLMAWSFPRASFWLAATIVVLRHWGQAAAR